MKVRLTNEGKIKLVLSFSLLVYASVISIVNRNLYAFLPMMWSSIGDISIMSSRGCIFGGERTNTFKFAIISFAFAHISYIAVMQTKLSITLFFISTFLLIFIVITSIKYNKTVPSSIYAIILIMNFINSIFFDVLAVVGLASFIISDAVLAKYEDEDVRWQILIWVTYVFAQICILTSLALTR